MKTIAKIILLGEIVFLIVILISKTSFLREKRVLNFAEEKLVVVNDEGVEYQIKTKAKKVSEVLAENNFKIGEKDEVFPAGETEILFGSNILINRQKQVTISVDGETLEKTSLAKTVEDVLAEEEIILSHADTVEPPLLTRLKDGLEIKITRIKTEETVEEEAIDFKTTEIKDKTVDWGQKEVSQAGEKGTRETKYRITYENGRQVSKDKIATNLTKEPVTEIIKIGTKIRVGQSDSGIASWYATDSDSCSSRDFPAGTWLRVTNLLNGKQTFVQVEGYGPQAGTGKLIDLSKSAFSKIASLGQGTTRVKVEEILNKGFSPP